MYHSKMPLFKKKSCVQLHFVDQKAELMHIMSVFFLSSLRTTISCFPADSPFSSMAR